MHLGGAGLQSAAAGVFAVSSLGHMLHNFPESESFHTTGKNRKDLPILRVCGEARETSARHDIDTSTTLSPGLAALADRSQTKGPGKMRQTSSSPSAPPAKEYLPEGNPTQRPRCPDTMRHVDWTYGFTSRTHLRVPGNLAAPCRNGMVLASTFEQWDSKKCNLLTL